MFDRLTQDQIAAALATGITNRDPQADVGPGEVRDIVVDAPAAVLEAVHDRAVILSGMVTREDPTIFDNNESDLDNIAATEGLTRDPGSGATGTVTFFRHAAVPAGVTIPVDAAFPVATADGGVAFATTQQRFATSTTPKNPATNRYEVQVPIVALTAGTSSRVGAQTLTRMLRPINGFDGVTNTTATVGGRARETNAQLLNRLDLAVVGRDVSARAGVGLNVATLFRDVESYYVANSVSSPDIVTRDDTNAVDVFVKGGSVSQISDTLLFLGVGQVHPILTPPLATVISVTAGAVALVEGTDYEIVLDTSGLSGSIRAADGIRFLIAPAGGVGSPFFVTYETNGLIAALQSRFSADDLEASGRDLLFRLGDAAELVLEATLTVIRGFNRQTVVDAVIAALDEYINVTLGMGATRTDFSSPESGAVQGSDLQKVVRAVTGVDNFVITRLTFIEDTAGTTDLPIEVNQYPFIDPTTSIILR